MRFLTAVAIAAVVGSVGPLALAQAPVTHTDGSFSTWIESFQYGILFQPYSVQPSGGNPGGCLIATCHMPAGSCNGTGAGYIDSSFTWNPATQGALASLDFSLESLCVNTNVPECGMGVSLLVEQNGHSYASGPCYGYMGSYGWESISCVGLTAGGFSLWSSPPAPPQPDFCGAPMRFGFVRASSTGCPNGLNYDKARAFDNFSVTIHPAAPTSPYPGTLCADLLLATAVNGVAGLAAVKTASAGNALTLELSTSNGTFAGLAPLMGACLFPTGSPPAPVPGLPEIHLDLTGIFFIYGLGTNPFTNPILQNGAPISLTFAVPVGLTGVSALFQGAVVTPLAPNGIFAITDGYEIQVL